jgi:hypothetical protein
LPRAETGLFFWRHQPILGNRKTARENVEGCLPKGTLRFEGKAVDCTMSAVREIDVRAVEGKSIPATFDMKTIVTVTAVKALFGIRISQVILSYDDLNDFLFRVAVEDCVSKAVYKTARKQNAPMTSFEKLEVPASEPQFQGKILALTVVLGIRRLAAGRPFAARRTLGPELRDDRVRQGDPRRQPALIGPLKVRKEATGIYPR